MKSFEYIQPKKLSDAAKINAKNKNSSLLYAGGTDLLGLMKDDILQPEKLINLKNFKELDFIEHKADGGVRIGALTKLARIADDEKIKTNFTALSLAASEVGTPQLRNVGTIAGNVCQRPRCFYFRGDFDCIRKGGGECFAISGNSKYHCIVGGDPCYIVHPSDTAVPLTLFDAEVQIFNGTKYRYVPIKEFFLLPEKNFTKENILEPGEIITEFILPPGKFNFSNFIKAKERGSWD
ncbi:MAG: xanthine dehydrogenase family protein subunit M, partial [Chlorobi bacterium]|nr:xanthine dehydrogenase family protein subunit M [Chlorobiota bacterium]